MLRRRRAPGRRIEVDFESVVGCDAVVCTAEGVKAVLPGRATAAKFGIMTGGVVAIPPWLGSFRLFFVQDIHLLCNKSLVVPF